MVPPSASEPATSFRTTVNHTTFQSGNVPILITVPHGGNDAPANVDARTTSYSGFVTSRELHLRDIAVALANELDTTHGITPYMVIGESHRQYIDYNRDETIAVSGGLNQAYEDADANTYYDEYHGRIAGYVSTIKSNHGGSGLLIDLHGASSVPDKLLRGTRNGDSIWALLSGHAVASITASEEPYPGETAVMAHDDDLGTRWRSWGTSEWIEFDLGSSKTIGSVEIAITEGDSRTYDFEIEVWNGSSWVVAYDGTNTQATSDFEIYEFSSPITGSKVRMSCHGSNVSQANYVKEIRIQEHGWAPIVGPNSIWGELADAGYALEPLNSEYGTGAETTLIGGFTVDHHGSENGGLDAFQMEIGIDYRDTQGERDDFVVDLAAAIDTYLDNY
jgi:N-formylglutamate amidohydrolase